MNHLDYSTVYIAVGSNLGNREKVIDLAKKSLKTNKRIQLIKEAPILETEPVGGPPQGKYLNTIWEIETDLNPFLLLAFLQNIEENLGRRRLLKNGPRTIDLDILFYDDLVFRDWDLVIPHPRIHERKFILELMQTLNPNYLHPTFDKSMAELLRELEDANRKSPQPA